jgi:hypothetical protein
MKTLLILFLAPLSVCANAECYSLYREGNLAYQNSQAPFDISSGSAELSAAEASGLRPVISPNDTCGGDDYHQRLEAVKQQIALDRYVVSQLPSQPDSTAMSSMRQQLMQIATRTGGSSETFSQRGDRIRQQDAAIAILTGNSGYIQEKRQTGRIVNAIEDIGKKLDMMRIGW